ncbi:MAG: YaiO family outer membrane beta-barrel protein [Owenweeksia sp.]
MKTGVFLIVLLAWGTTHAQSPDWADSLQHHLEHKGYFYTKNWSKSQVSAVQNQLKPLFTPIAIAHMNDGVSLRQQTDRVDGSQTWSETQLGLTLKGKKHTAVFSGYRASRFGQNSHQFDWDHYWVAHPKFYFNLNASVSDAVLFPAWKGAATWSYTGFEKKEIALAYRYHAFPGNPVHMIGLSATWYVNDLYAFVHYFNVRTTSGSSNALLFRLRQYLHNQRGYFMLNGAFGAEVDRSRISGQLLTSNRIGGGFHYRLSPLFSAEVVLAAEKQALSEDLSRNLLSTNFSVTYHFQRTKRK